MERLEIVVRVNEKVFYRRPLGVTLLSFFFLLGASMCLLSLLALALPESFLRSIWRLNPAAHLAFSAMGPWAFLLMVLVGFACATAAVGLTTCAEWGRRLAIAVLGVNLVGDMANAIARQDPRTLIGLPIGAAMIAYLMRGAVRRCFAQSRHSRVAEEE